MNIAICFSGHVRTYKRTYDNFITNIIDPNRHHKIDIFLSTWRNIDSKAGAQHIRLERWGHEHTINESNIDANELTGLYDPTVLDIESEIPFDISNIVTTIHPVVFSQVGLYSMLYKINRVDNLRQDREKSLKTKYDLVVRNRFDILQPKPIVFDEINKDLIYLPSMDYADFQGYDWYNDKFAIGSSDNMSTYCSWFTKLEHLSNKYNIIQPEINLFQHLTEHNIQVHKLGYELEIVR